MLPPATLRRARQLFDCLLLGTYSWLVVTLTVDPRKEVLLALAALHASPVARERLTGVILGRHPAKALKQAPRRRSRRGNR